MSPGTDIILSIYEPPHPRPVAERTITSRSKLPVVVLPLLTSNTSFTGIIHAGSEGNAHVVDLWSGKTLANVYHDSVWRLLLFECG
jgi:hypothetical protein